jgi:arylsulfatase A-like enzyme
MREFRYLQPLAVRQRMLSDPRELEHITALYDGEISYTDAEVGRVLSGLAAIGSADNTVVILTADHGESLTEHHYYFDHAEYLYQTCVHVPLIVRLPHRRYAGTRWPGPVRLIDVAPTILDVVGLHRAAAALDGHSLLPILDGTEAVGQRMSLGAVHQGEDDDARSRYYVREKNYKLIWSFDRREALSDEPAGEELYDLAADPGELQNLIGAAPPVADQLRNQLRTWVHEMSVSQERGRSDEIKQRLRALGYL